MSISRQSVSEGAVSETAATSDKTKTPPKRQMTALADPRLIPEPR